MVTIANLGMGIPKKSPRPFVLHHTQCDVPDVPLWMN